jgi:hypothetical protein
MIFIGKKGIKLNIKSSSLKLILLAVFWMAGHLALASEETDLRSKQLIDDYVQAVRSDNPQDIRSSWQALNTNQDAKQYMQVNLPRLDYLFRIRGLYMDLQKIQESRPEYFGGENPTVSVDKSVNILKRDLSPKAVVEVSKFSLSEKDNTVPRTNGEIAMASQGQTLIDNRAIAMGNPNQNKITNKDYVQTRADRMFSSKFQDVPGELVPRGSTFPKSKPEITSDVIIKNLSTRLILSKKSPADQSVDIYINDALVGRDILITEPERSFQVYFVQGVNRLRVENHEQPQGKVASLSIYLEGVIFARENAWLLKSGRSGQWLVETRLDI